MKLIGLLIALAIVGLLVARQQGGPSPEGPKYDAEAPQPPRVPTQGRDVPQFERDMDHFMDDSERQQKERIEEMTR